MTATTSADVNAVPRVPVVDGLRAVAALGVVVGHTWVGAGAPRPSNPLAPLIFSGGLGVDMFFVISGFLLFMPYAAGTPLPTRSYAKRRAARLLPAYYVSIAVVLAIWLWVDPPNLSFPLATASGWFDVIAHVTVLQWIILPLRLHQVGLGVNAPWWSLTVEVCFYAALPFIAVRFCRKPWAWAIGVVAFGFAFRLATLGVGALHPEFHGALWGLAAALGDGILGFSGHFAAGMAAAWVVVRLPNALNRRQLYLLFGVGAAAFLGVAWAVGKETMRVVGGDHPHQVVYIVGRPIFGVGFAMILVAIVRLGVLDRVLGAGPLKWIGDRSYGVYLFHAILIASLYYRTSLFTYGSQTTATFAKALLVIVPISIMLGALSFELVERPMIRWARKREDGPIATADDAALARRVAQ